MSEESSSDKPAEKPPAKKSRKPRAAKRKAGAPMSKKQGGALFAASLALGQVITLALSKWMGVH